MTKHAVEGLTKALALEAAPFGIRVNAVAPTFVRTPMTEGYFADAEFSEFVHSRIPLGRCATPEDVADAVYFPSLRCGVLNYRHKFASRWRMDCTIISPIQ